MHLRPMVFLGGKINTVSYFFEQQDDLAGVFSQDIYVKRMLSNQTVAIQN